MNDVTSLPACLYEDGSGGSLPCHWDAAVQGNGTGESFVVNADGTLTYDAVPTSCDADHYLENGACQEKTLSCPSGTWADDAADECRPLTVQPATSEVLAQSEPAAALTVAPPASVAAVTVAQPAPAELAHTGVDPVGGLVAALMVGVGVVLVMVRRAARSL